MVGFVLAVVAVLAVPSSEMAPGEGLSLSPGPARSVAGSTSGSPMPNPVVLLPAVTPAATPPVAPHPAMPFGLGLGGLALVAGGLAAGRSRGGGPRRRYAGPVGGTGPPPDMLFVFISGHGSEFTGNFEELQHMIGATDEQVRSFDYTWLSPDRSHRGASQLVRLSDLADGLQSYLAGLQADGRPIYLVGHSKGGAAIAELLARWDRRPHLRVEAVVGAALLDPPIARGLLGEFQEIGWVIPALADNGGYDPIECSWFRCRDTRAHLGDDAGVEVIVVRNPDAMLTNFHDNPEGLRVYDLVDDGDVHALGRLWRRGSVIDRIGDAHAAVLLHPAVAACIREESIALGSCRWEGDSARKVFRLRPWGRGRGYGPVVK